MRLRVWVNIGALPAAMAIVRPSGRHVRSAQPPPFPVFESIQRKDDDGFGEGNFKALFESLERDQIRRGALQVVA